MASPKQIKANQLNSRKSTGPKSSVGKSIVSKNAIKHGILSSETLLPWESLDELNELIKNMHDCFKPVGQIEATLVDKLISATWRLKRAGRIETGLFARGRYALNYQISDKTASNISPDCDGKHIEALQMLDGNTDHIDLAFLFSEKLDGQLCSLSRYESGLERAFYKALHELQRIQATRKGCNPQLPIAIDITSDLENKEV